MAKRQLLIHSLFLKPLIYSFSARQIRIVWELCLGYTFAYSKAIDRGVTDNKETNVFL